MNFNEVAVVRLLNECPLCSSKKLKPVLSECNHYPSGMHSEVTVFNNTWINLLQCQDCTFAFTEQLPVSPTFFINRYDNTWYNPEEESGGERKSEILDDIFANLKQMNISSGNLLDVGSFAGKLLLLAKKNGFTPSGVEINPKLAKYTREKLGFDVINSEFQRLSLEHNKYNVITIIDVLEHLVDPRLVLKNLAEGLAPGGVLVIKVPNYPMQRLKQKIANIVGLSSEGIFANFGHINHFTVDSMSKLLPEAGLELVNLHISRSEKWYGTTFIERVKNVGRDIFYYVTRSLSVKLGLNICYYAQKKK